MALATQEIIRQIEEAFGGNPYPGDSFLQGSFEGCEPYEEVGAFAGKSDWRQLDATMLDGHYCALGFFSEAGFRFFVPAYMIADLREQLRTADLFHLCHGFDSTAVEVSAASQKFVRGYGGPRLLNPRRYGAMSWEDYARYRLSVFTCEEASAIVSYINYRRDRDTLGTDKAAIDASLEKFWRSRAETAPTHESLGEHLRDEARYVAAVNSQNSHPAPPQAPTKATDRQ